MKKLYLVILLLNFQLFAQLQTYDFGTGTGTFSTASTGSDVFLPTAPSGTARVYIGGAGGQFSLVNPGVVGTGSELQGTAATLNADNNINKFSIYNINSPSALFSLRFSFRLDGGENGSEWLLLIGKNGGYFQNGVVFVNSVYFCAVKFQFSSTSAINSYVNLNGTSWDLVSWGINKGENHVFEVFANNTNSTTANYTYGTSQNVGPYSYDIWLDGTLVNNDESRTGLAVDLILDSFAFVGRLSSGNAAMIYLDDIYYSNALEPGPLPVELSSFTSSIIGNTINLKWETATEVNNYGFDVERKVGNGQSSVGNYEKIGFVNGNGNSNSPKFYSFEDKNQVNGKYSYRLKQIDNDGQYEYSKAIEVDLGNPREYSLSQNFPNPFNPVSTIEYSVPSAGFVSLKVYDILGREVTNLVNEVQNAGKYTVNFNGEGLGSGIYFYTLQTDNIIISRKMNLLK
jgi:hypothetical protein